MWIILHLASKWKLPWRSKMLTGHLGEVLRVALTSDNYEFGRFLQMCEGKIVTSHMLWR